ncbi:MAG: type II secretion system F family protein [Nanoarchaeota archaeon]
MQSSTNNAEEEEKQSKWALFKSRVKGSRSERIKWFSSHIEKAGYEITPYQVEAVINRASLAFAIISFVYLLGEGTNLGVPILNLAMILVLALFTVFFLSLVSLHVAFRIFVDIKKFRRKLMIEDVLPEFFQLASANMRAGMPIDRALWFAVRPKFGVLANEIEEVAKKTFAGGKMDEALVEFAKKYDSKVVLRSIFILNSGMRSGGNVGDILDKLAINIQAMKTLKKEMAANVTTYAIFITFAAIVAAPLLFGLTGQLLVVVQDITGDIDVVDLDNNQAGGGQQAGMGMGGGMDMGLGGIGEGFGGGEESVKREDFKIFTYVSLALSSLFSAMIVSTIKSGSVKEGARNIPIFMLTSFVIFNVADYVMGIALGAFL